MRLIWLVAISITQERFVQVVGSRNGKLQTEAVECPDDPTALPALIPSDWEKTKPTMVGYGLDSAVRYIGGTRSLIFTTPRALKVTRMGSTCEEMYMFLDQESIDPTKLRTSMRSYRLCAKLEKALSPEISLRWDITSSALRLDGDRKGVGCIFTERDDVEGGQGRVYGAMRKLAAVVSEEPAKSTQNDICASMLFTFIKIQNAFTSEYKKRQTSYTVPLIPTGETILSDEMWSARKISYRTDPTAMISVTSAAYVREACTEEFEGFNQDMFRPHEVKSILTKLKYRLCASPAKDAVYNYKGLYEIDSEVVKVGDKKKLTCTYVEFIDTSVPAADDETSPADTASNVPLEEDNTVERTFTISRETNSLSFFNGAYSYMTGGFRHQVRSGESASKERELAHCLQMLVTFIQIQNAMIDSEYKGRGVDYQPFFMASIDGEEFVADAGAGAASSKSESSTSEGFGTGYIIIIVVGAIVILGGGLYAYKKFSTTAPAAAAPKRSRRSKKAPTTTVEGDSSPLEEGSGSDGQKSDNTVAQSRSLLLNH